MVWISPFSKKNLAGFHFGHFNPLSKRQEAQRYDLPEVANHVAA